MNEGKRPLWYLYLILKNRWFLVKALLIIMIPTIIVTFIMKKKYTVNTVIMPPEEQSSPGLSLAGLGAADFAGYFSGGMGFSLPLMTTMSDVYDEILKSRSLADHVILSTAYIDSVNLRDKYDQDEQLGLYLARKQFSKNFSSGVTPSGFLSMEFTAGDPWYAVEVSEAIINSLDSINAEITFSRMRQSRIFLQQRADMADSMLTATSIALADFEDTYGLVAPEQEIIEYITHLSELKTEYMTLLTEIAALRQGISGASSPAILFKQRSAEQLLDVINMLESGEAAPGYEEVMPSINRSVLHDINFEYANLQANYEMSLVYCNTIRISLQEAIAAEEKDLQPVRVLDPPRHPGWKSKPKKVFIWIEVFLLAFISLIGFLIIRENIRTAKLEKPEAWKPWQILLSEIKRDFRFRKK